MWQKEHCDRAFATDKVTSTGQIIAGIVGTSKRIAQKAASLGIFYKCCIYNMHVNVTLTIVAIVLFN